MEINIDGVLHEFDVDKAKEFGVLVKKSKYPSWGEVCERILEISEIEYMNDYIYESICALNKVLIMREAWLEDTAIDNSANYYYIAQHYDRLNVFEVLPETNTFHKDYPLTFPTREIAEKFLEKFKNDLLNCKMFL